MAVGCKLIHFWRMILVLSLAFVTGNKWATTQAGRIPTTINLGKKEFTGVDAQFIKRGGRVADIGPKKG